MQIGAFIPELSAQEVVDLTNRSNPKCKFHNFIGNDAAIETILDILHQGFKNWDRRNPGVGLLLAGPASVGKSTVAKKFADSLGIPYLSTIASEVPNTEYLLKQIEAVLDSSCVSLYEQGKNSGKILYELPPMCIFMDEIHTLKSSVRDGLLMACEQASHRLITKQYDVDTKNVWWIIATTELGALPKPLETRFVQIYLKPYTTAEVAQIVHMNSPDIDIDRCYGIAQCAVNIPRVAIDMAKEAAFCMGRANLTLEEAIQKVQNRRGVNKDGLDSRHIKLLKSLLSCNKSRRQICDSMGMSETEVARYILPPLMSDSIMGEPLIIVTNRHKITDAGRKYLEEHSDENA